MKYRSFGGCGASTTSTVGGNWPTLEPATTSPTTPAMHPRRSVKRRFRS